MFNQNLHTNTDENNPCPQFGTQVHALAEVHSDEAPDDREYKRYDADNQNREGDAVPSGHTGTGKGDTYRQGIDTGCHGQRQNHQKSGRVEVVFLFIAETFLNHAYPQEKEQTEGNPMVVLLDEAVEMIGRKPTHQRHQGLEQSEEEAERNKRFPAYAAQDDTAGDGNGEAVHGQADSQ